MSATPSSEDWLELLRHAIQSGNSLDLRHDSASSRPHLSSTSHTLAFGHRIPASLIRQVLLIPELQADPGGLTVIGGTITGTLNLEHVSTPCSLALVLCRFENAPRLTGIKIHTISLQGSHLPGLNLDSSNIEGNISLIGLHATDAVHAFGARINGQLDLSEAVLVNEGGISLALDGAHINNGIFLLGLKSTGEVRIVNAHIGGGFHLQGEAVLANNNGTALQLNNTRVDGGVFLMSLTATGEVLADNARISGQLNLRDAVLTNQGGTALSIEGAHINDAFFPGLQTNGQVRASAAYISGQLLLRNARLTNKSAVALSLDRAQIGGDAVLAGLHAFGQIRAIGLHVSGQFDLRDRAVLTNEGGKALILNRAQVDRDALLADLRTNGTIDVSGARFTGYLDLSSVVFENNYSNFIGEAVKVETLLLGKKWTMNGTVNLARAEIGALVVDDTLPQGNLIADGWQIKTLNFSSQVDRRAGRALMTTWLCSAGHFIPQPWHEVANVFERAGRPTDARAFRIKAATLTTKASPWWAKPARWVYGLLVAHGHQPLRAGGWLLAAIVMATVLTSMYAGSFTPTNPASLEANLIATASTDEQDAPTLRAATVSGATSCQALERAYACLKPLQYGFDVVLPPTLSTGQASAWRTTSGWLAFSFQLLRILAWLLITLLVAGVTGLLRKT